MASSEIASSGDPHVDSMDDGEPLGYAPECLCIGCAESGRGGDPVSESEETGSPVEGSEAPEAGDAESEGSQPTEWPNMSLYETPIEWWDDFKRFLGRWKSRLRPSSQAAG